MRLVIPSCALAGALVIAVASGCGSSGSSTSPTTTTTGSQQSLPSIHFRYPPGWGQLPKSRWAAVGAPKSAAAVIERKGNSANLVVLRGGKTKVNHRTEQKLDSRLKAQYSDYQFVSAEAIKLPNAGSPVRAMLFAYDRVKQGVFHTITVIPAGKISFVVLTASPPKSKAIAREISRILKSARLTYPKQ